MIESIRNMSRGAMGGFDNYWGCLSGGKPPKALPVVSNHIMEINSQSAVKYAF